MDRAAVQWINLTVDAQRATLSYGGHGQFYDNSSGSNVYWYYYPSLVVNCAGDMVTGFSGSSATNYIGAFYASRLSDGSNFLSPHLIQDGTPNYTGGGLDPTRWGDYSATTLDPTNDWTFWTVQEYASPSRDPLGGAEWSTVISKIRPQP